MTLGVFPVPIPGELLYGVLARHGFLAGSPNAAEHATELFGRRSAVATFDLPSGLDALASRLPGALGLGGRALLGHTLFPFYSAFQPEEGREAAACDMLAGDAPNAHHRLGVAAFRIRSAGALRFCSACLAAQRLEHGFATWMVAHQLPGVPVCAVHGIWLRDSLVTRTSAGRHGYVAPSDANCPAVDGSADGARCRGSSSIWRVRRPCSRAADRRRGPSPTGATTTSRVSPASA